MAKSVRAVVQDGWERSHLERVTTDFPALTLAQLQAIAALREAGSITVLTDPPTDRALERVSNRLNARWAVQQDGLTRHWRHVPNVVEVPILNLDLLDMHTGLPLMHTTEWLHITLKEGYIHRGFLPEMSSAQVLLAQLPSFVLYYVTNLLAHMHNLPADFLAWIFTGLYDGGAFAAADFLQQKLTEAQFHPGGKH